MTLTLAVSRRDIRTVVIDDLYAVEFTFYSGPKKEKGSLFILFNDENKVLSFAGLTIGDHTTLVQF